MRANTSQKKNEVPCISPRCNVAKTLSHAFRSVSSRLAAAYHRRRWRKAVRRAAFVGVVLVTNLSLLICQTQAYEEIHRQIHMPPRVDLSAGIFSHLVGAVRSAVNSIHMSILGTIPPLPIPGSPCLSDQGIPFAWQVGIPAAPFCTVNMANGNLLTSVPIVDWQGLGLPISFSLFHNTLGDEPGQTDVLLPKWTHSYSRHVSYDPEADSWTLFLDAGGYLLFTPTETLGVYESSPGFHLTLDSRYAVSVRITFKDQSFDEYDLFSGRLIRMADASGNSSNLTYEVAHGGERLAAIEDASHNVLKLHYNDSTGKLVHIEAPPIGLDSSEVQRVWDINHIIAAGPLGGESLCVSTARRAGLGDPWGDPDGSPPVFPDPPLFAAQFELDGDQIIGIRDYSGSYDEMGNPRPGTHYSINYDEEGRVAEIVADDSPDGLQLSRTFTFENVPRLTLEIRPLEDSYVVDPAARLRPGTWHATMTGYRTNPGPDTTHYYFDSSGRLYRVIDPLGRRVAEITWDNDNNPTQATNVLGGITTQTFDDNGNVLSIESPNGYTCSYTYDELNNLTEMQDSIGCGTSLSYNDPTNPTRPTTIQSNGVSKTSLQWGQGYDSSGWLAYDSGKLLRTISPNMVEQQFHTWSPPEPEDEGGGGTPEPASLFGFGQTYETTFGRNRFNGSEAPVMEGITMPDQTGNPVVQAEEGEECGMRMCRVCGVEGPALRDAATGQPPCPDCVAATCYCAASSSEKCTKSYDADGNQTSLCQDTECDSVGLADPLDGENDILYNGKSQLLFVVQPIREGWGSRDHSYTFEYDALGRKTAEIVNGPEGEWGSTFLLQATVYLQHTVHWSYNDQTGDNVRVLNRDRARHPTQAEELPLYTITETDLAGRVTRVTQNGLSTDYSYGDDVSLPVVTVTKPDGTVTEHYVDVAGQTRMIVHKDASGDQVLAFEYHRDLRGRVVRVEEYVDVGTSAQAWYEGQAHYRTTYTYGDGHLALNELDTGSEVEDGKFYYSWWEPLAGSDYFELGGDPNRLVRETRTLIDEGNGVGDDAVNIYDMEYRYDAGGNRLAKVERDDEGEIFKIIRYNYAYRPHCDMWANLNPYGYDPRSSDGFNCDTPYTGEPIYGETSGMPVACNDYALGGSHENMDAALGQDKLLSYTSYYYTADGHLDATQKPIWTAYDYSADFGELGYEVSWNGETNVQTLTHYTYDKRSKRVASVEWREFKWPSGGCWVQGDQFRWSDPQDKTTFLEIYAYNIFGERVGVVHGTRTGACADWYPDESECPCGFCSRWMTMYDYAEGASGRRELVIERESNQHCADACDGLYERLMSVYTWGPTGLSMRRGVSLRNGAWDPTLGDDCDGNPETPEKRGAFQPDATNAMANFTYMADQMGNIVGMVDCDEGIAKRQVFDAFGNNIGGYMTFRCASDCDFADNPFHLETGLGWYPLFDDLGQPLYTTCPEVPAQPIERMQTRMFNWRGNEGSQTDMMHEDIADHQTFQLYEPGQTEETLAEDDAQRWPAYTRPSTGLIYMQARYYNPETGRFTQADPQPYDVGQLMNGQNNRWTYCGNDPVNLSDPSGLSCNFWMGVGGLLTFVAGLLSGGIAGYLAALAGVIAMGQAGWLSLIVGFLLTWWWIILPVLVIIALLAATAWLVVTHTPAFRNRSP